MTNKIYVWKTLGLQDKKDSMMSHCDEGILDIKIKEHVQTYLASTLFWTLHHKDAVKFR